MKSPVSLAALTLAFPAISAFAEAQPEAPMETAGPGALIGFGVIAVLLIGAYVWYTSRASKKEREMEAKQKSPQA